MIKEEKLKELRKSFYQTTMELKDYSGQLVGLSSHLRIGYNSNYKSTYRTLGYVNIQIQKLTEKLDEIQKELIRLELHKDID